MFRVLETQSTPTRSRRPCGSGRGGVCQRGAVSPGRGKSADARRPALHAARSTIGFLSSRSVPTLIRAPRLVFLVGALTSSRGPSTLIRFARGWCDQRRCSTSRLRRWRCMAPVIPALAVPSRPPRRMGPQPVRRPSIRSAAFWTGAGPIAHRMILPGSPYSLTICFPHSSLARRGVDRGRHRLFTNDPADRSVPAAPPARSVVAQDAGQAPSDSWWMAQRPRGGEGPSWADGNGRRVWRSVWAGVNKPLPFAAVARLGAERRRPALSASASKVAAAFCCKFDDPRAWAPIS